MKFGPAEVDAEALERHLKALAFESRIQLLALLRTPKTLDEIDLQPADSQAGASPERNISRQAVRNHLDKLIEVGLVRVRLGERRGDKGRKSVHEYVLDHARLFATVDELRKLSVLEPEGESDPYATSPLAKSADAAWPDGVKLVVVRGANEGRPIPLRHAQLAPPRGWVVGRSPRCAARLQYDPYVSSENTEIVPDGKGGYRLLDLRASKNGTSLNWRPLPTGGEAPLRAGDVIGVGRSLLLFRLD